MPSIRSAASTTPSSLQKRGEPVVPVRQDHDSAGKSRTSNSFSAPRCIVADDRLGGHDPLAVQNQPQPQHAVRGGVLRADVEDHVLGGQARTDPCGALHKLSHDR